MSDDLDIRSGGVVAVDTQSLRAAADDLAAVAASLREVAREAGRLDGTLIWAGASTSGPRMRAEDAAADADRIVRDLRDLADLYELVERAAADGCSASGPAAQAIAAWERERASGFDAHVLLAGLLTGGTGLALAQGVLGLVPLLDRGRLPPGTTLAPGDGTVRTTLLSTGAAEAPASLDDLVARIPGGDARVRVERYDLPGGTVQFVAYVDGTQVGAGPGEPFDMASNLELYLRREASDSYDAVRQALRQAGAEPGATVHLVGYSQGAMAVSHLALSGEYEVPTLVTVGSPVAADVGDDTLSVALRHTDDPVAYLAAGGFAMAVGAAGGFVAERRVGSVNPLAPHLLTNYRETAARLDASPDPRMDAVRRRLAGLGGAASVSVSTYGAQRVPRSGGGGA